LWEDDARFATRGITYGHAHIEPFPFPLPYDHLLQNAVARANPVAALCIHIEGAARIISRAGKRPILRVLDKRLSEGAANIRRLTVFVWQLVKHEAPM